MAFEIKSENVNLSADEEKKIQDALDALAKDPHAPREVSVKLTLHIHHEYPKHVTVGKDKDGNPVTKVVNSPEEEKALLGASIADSRGTAITSAVSMARGNSNLPNP